jgi:hypothetical protein
MKMVPWVLLGISVVLFIICVYSKFAGPEGWVLGYAPKGWWRAAMAGAVYAIAFKLLHENGKLSG